MSLLATAARFAAERAGRRALLAEELRLTHHPLSSISGAFTSDALLCRMGSL